MQMKKLPLTHLLFWILAAGSIFLILVSKKGTEPVAADLQDPMPGADAQQLWKYITKDNNYKSWKNFPNLPARIMRAKENPHGDWIAAYLNNEAYESISKPSYPFQMKYAAIVVKENYALTKGPPRAEPGFPSVPLELVSLTVMYKIKGYQRTPGEQEWFWVMYGCNKGQCDGNVATIGNQPWVNMQIPGDKDTFAFFKGEVMTGKPWLCIECHQRARVAGQYAFGDYVFKLPPFAQK